MKTCRWNQGRNRTGTVPVPEETPLFHCKTYKTPERESSPAQSDTYPHYQPAAHKPCPHT